MRHPGNTGYRLPQILAAACLLATMVSAQAQIPGRCGKLTTHHGPFDYRTEHSDKTAIVNDAHFTTEVENLIRGNRGSLAADIDYTLRAIPNHHRALVSMMRLGDRLKVDKVPDATYDVECYFLRALTFRSDDTTVRMLYANWLNGRRRVEDARLQLNAAVADAGDNAFTNYNLGLMFLEVGQPERAAEMARRALELGFPRTELRDRLVAAGKWPAAASAPK